MINIYYLSILMLVILTPISIAHIATNDIGFAGDSCLVNSRYIDMIVDEDNVKQHRNVVDNTPMLSVRMPGWLVRGHVEGHSIDGLSPFWANGNNSIKKSLISNSLVHDLKSGRVAPIMNGRFIIDTLTINAGTAVIMLKNDYINVNDDANIGAPKLLNYFPSRGGNVVPYQIVFPSSTPEEIAAANTFITLDSARLKLEELDFKIPEISAVVNVEWLSCNAFYIGDLKTMMFGQQYLERCANTAYSTVIVHEYGHAILEEYIETPPLISLEFAAYHEAFADSFSMLILNTDCMGLDFEGENTGCFRNLSEIHYYPVKNTTNAHAVGRPLSGAFWTLKVELEKLYTTDTALKMTLLYLRYMAEYNNEALTRNITNYILDADKMLYDGMHQDIIESSFASRNFTR